MPTGTGEAEGQAEIENEMEIDFSKKKKKKRPKSVESTTGEGCGREGDDHGVVVGGGVSHTGPDTGAAEASPKGTEGKMVAIGLSPWSPASVDAVGYSADAFSYTYLLSRLRDQLRIDCPSHPSLRELGEKERSRVPPPKLARVGGRRTALCNFGALCEAMHRPREHLQHFLLSELATSGSLDEGGSTLTLLARLDSKAAEQLVRRYVHEFVTCKECKSLDTLMGKVRSETMLRCHCCAAERLLPPIKNGFRVVRRGDRRANREQ